MFISPHFLFSVLSTRHLLRAISTGALIFSSALLLSSHSRLPSPSIDAWDEYTSEAKPVQTLQATANLPPRSTLVASTPGAIRVRNATYHPIRIALLPQVQASSASRPNIPSIATSPQSDLETAGDRIHISDVNDDSPPAAPQYGEPIHWDFVPREGHSNGLILAVADGHLKVQPGDILTAFAQDGSRRYWGPYVVGATDAPVWDSETQEWSLVLETPFP